MRDVKLCRFVCLFSYLFIYLIVSGMKGEDAFIQMTKSRSLVFNGDRFDVTLVLVCRAWGE